MGCETTSASVLGREYMLATGWSTTAVGRAAAKSASAANPGIWYQRSSEAEKKSVGRRGTLWVRLPHQDANPSKGGCRVYLSAATEPYDNESEPAHRGAFPRSRRCTGHCTAQRCRGKPGFPAGFAVPWLGH